jgi:PBP4 family serine-type D-alanyl-D-alanine carboxypeptidase
MNTKILYEGRIADGIVTGNIVLQGSGNCFLSTADLRRAANMLHSQGIKTVTGDVVVNVTNFDTYGLERTRRGAGYAPVSALGLNLHTVSITVIPGESGQPPIVKAEPPNTQVRFAISARTVAGGKSTVSVTQNDDYSFQVSGEIPHDSVPLHWRFSVADPAGYAAQSFRTVLAQAGIQIMGKVEKGIVPLGVTTLATLPGPAIEQIVAEMNFNSLNIAADSLLLALGALDDGLPGTRDKGLKVIQDHLARHGILSENVRIVDGSGLLPGNRIAPKTLARYLVAVAKTPWFAALYQSLPRAGIDGTLRGGSFRNERFRAKSGSLENVAALAGYGVDKTGRELAFAFIVNSTGPLPPNARAAGDSIMQFIADEVLQ